MAGRENSRDHSIFQLEKDVLNLQLLLQEEIKLHDVLEKAVEDAAFELSDLSCLPNDAQELLCNITTLKNTVGKLEEEMIYLNFQLIQERNERRLVEYQLKQLPGSLQIMYPIAQATLDDLALEEEEGPTELIQQFAAIERVPLKGVLNHLHPNKLSEEIVRCMKDIFISLANCHSFPSTFSSPESFCSSSSPQGHIPTFWPLSELTSISSWRHSSQVDIQYNNDVLTTGGVFDPYKVREKLSWIDIGNYSLVKEVSWMSVEKKQLEAASDLLKVFRSLVEQLTEVNPIHLSYPEKLAFWVNLYNALIMHAYLAYGVPKSDMKLFALMQKAAYIVGGHSYSAACIEYVVLKMKPPIHRPQTALLLALQKLKLSEEQKRCSIDTYEPLVTFALSCGTFSSPAVKVYSAGNVKEELQQAQRDFIRASVGMSNKRKLLIPKMLHAFTRGFVDESNLPIWISGFLTQQQAGFVEQCISQRKYSLLGSRSCGVIPYDSRFRYLFLPEILR
ncbi:uncharacterized protein LOC110029578 [Phalaenopsis equestris]|uniref:uncharacterized protein LOC110029578 n=2 Tax=Phalaenopsis equestris TaxID=78828 RepID=UPI0009E50630|nr:uncharacterized protein LOC110029578 [Phalaenopsis equestris]XP_020587590.1 uncharacterized protein LOC110029578 [Phalaenopsis equestris]XP_020587591.1 uncharacterized protein LOC110029578 [Phalaenopsis equestris]